MLFLQYIPQNLHNWLGVQIGAGGEVAERACAMVDDGLKDRLSFIERPRAAALRRPLREHP